MYSLIVGVNSEIVAIADGDIAAGSSERLDDEPPRPGPQLRISPRI